MLIPACIAFKSVTALFIVWGASMTAVGMAFQTIVLDMASDATDIAVSLYSGIFNVGIGGGAFIGSKVSEQFGLGVLGYVGAAFVALSVMLCLISLIRKGTSLAR